MVILMLTNIHYKCYKPTLLLTGGNNYIIANNWWFYNNKYGFVWK